MKLQLDDIIIQQSLDKKKFNKQKNPNKKEIASMIRHGIDEILETNEDEYKNNIENMDIDVILQQGMENSKKFNELIMSKAKNRFSITSNDYSLIDDVKDLHLNKNDLINKVKNFENNNKNNIMLKSLRSRDINLRSKENTPLFDTPITSKKKNIKINSLENPYNYTANMKDHQFFNVKRLTEIYNMELAYYLKYEHTFEEDIPTIDNIDRKTGLSIDVLNERDELLSKGFKDWNMKHLWAYAKACRENGRDDIESIIRSVKNYDNTKSEDDIKRYHKVFWIQCKHLQLKSNGKRRTKQQIIDEEKSLENAEFGDLKDIVRRIEIGENKLGRDKKFANLIKRKLNMYNKPMDEMRFLKQYVTYDHKSHGFELIHDRYLIYLTHIYGYGNWDRIRQAFLDEPMFKFDYFVKSRIAGHYVLRMRNLISSIEKEFRQIDNIKNGVSK